MAPPKETDDHSMDAERKAESSQQDGDMKGAEYSQPANIKEGKDDAPRSPSKASADYGGSQSDPPEKNTVRLVPAVPATAMRTLGKGTKRRLRGIADQKLGGISCRRTGRFLRRGSVAALELLLSGYSGLAHPR